MERINRLLRKLKETSTISEEEYRRLYASGSSPGILYGLAKTHKIGIPLRPILAAYNTATYSLSKFLIPLIEPFSTNDYTLRNSHEFVESLRFEY